METKAQVESVEGGVSKLVLNLTTFQRVKLAQVIGGLQGDVSLVRKAVKLLDVLELTQAEREQIGYALLPDGRAVWRDAGHRFRIEIPDGNQVALLKQSAEQYAGWEAGAWRDVLDLFEQLGISA